MNTSSADKAISHSSRGYRVTQKRKFRTARKLIGGSILCVWLIVAVWLFRPLATLSSLKKVDDYPLYTMTYYGAYEASISTASTPEGVISTGTPNSKSPHTVPTWACSLFAAFGDKDNRLYGRNFDWHYSPAVLLFTNPPDGYASVSMIDIAYLDFEPAEVNALTDLPLLRRRALLNLPSLPFDGMNEYGLTVGMAAVPSGEMRPDPTKDTISSLMAIRELLDHARDVDEAVTLLGSYNIDMEGGPPLHYLVADRLGHAVLVEFYRGQMEVFSNEAPWHLATNFLRASAGESPQGRCQRYDKINQQLEETTGQINQQEGMDLLTNVSQANTQWSVIYDMSSGNVNVAMGRGYKNVHTFHLRLASQ